MNDLQGGGQLSKPCLVKGVALPGYVHPGFCAYYNSLVQGGIDTALADLAAANPGLHLLFTGHSLGAAAATIAAADVGFRLKLKSNRILLYTFGEPRVGNKVFAEYVDSTVDGSARVVHSCDLVTNLAPCCASVNWLGQKSECSSEAQCPYHRGNAVHYSEDSGADWVECSAGEDPKCGCGNLWQQGLQGIQDHQAYFGVELVSECCSWR